MTSDEKESDETSRQQVNKAESESPVEYDRERDGDGDTGGTPSLDELLRVLLEETTLWPLVIVLYASGGAFGAAMLVLALVDRNPFAAAALLLVVGMTVDLAWRARNRTELRLVARGIGLLWITAMAMAALAWGFGIT